MICRTCKQFKNISCYSKDNPVLECGHEQIPLTALEITKEIQRKTNEQVLALMDKSGLSEDQALAAIIERKRIEREKQRALDAIEAEVDSVPVNIISKRNIRREHLIKNVNRKIPKHDTPIPWNTWDDIEELASKFG